jgi:nickel-dependent lactate racemase
MISNPNSTWGITEGNPIWEEVNEVSEKIEKKFLVNVTLNRDKEITGVFSGELKEAHKRGCEFVKNSSMIPVNNEFDIVVTSNSGYPLDLNLYQTIKGVSAAAKIVKNGGAIIIASDCWDGIPDHGLFGKLLSEADSPLSLLEDILNSDFPRQDQWQAQIQTQIQQKADVYLYTENLTEKQIFDSLLIPSKSIENTIREIMSRRSDKLKICVLPEGPQTIAYID